MKFKAVLLLAQPVVVVGAYFNQGLVVVKLCTSFLLYLQMKIKNYRQGIQKREEVRVFLTLVVAASHKNPP